MANYDEAWQVLDEFKFEIDSKSSIYVKCIICKKLLRNAFQGPCGCSYCKNCIDEYLKKGGRYCPGDSVYCKTDELSFKKNVSRNNSTNKIVSELQLKCPSTSCSFQCPLIQMSDHLKVCDKRIVSCPFSEIGCTTMGLPCSKISDHLVGDIYNHSQLLIKWIANTKNDIKYLESKDKHEVTPLESVNVYKSMSLNMSKPHTNDHQKKKKDMMEDLQIEIKELSRKNEELTGLVKEMKDINERKIHQQAMEIDRLKRESLSRYKVDATDFSNNKSLSYEKDLNYSNFETIIPTKTKQTLLSPSESTLFSKTPKKKIGWHVWDINRLSKLRKTNDYVESDFFLSVDQEYRMWLRLYTNGHNSGIKAHMTIQFCIWNVTGQEEAVWPFKGDVTISIKNKNKLLARKSLAKYCILELNRKNSEAFDFLYSDLEKSGVLENDTISIECSVEIDE